MYFNGIAVCICKKTKKKKKKDKHPHLHPHPTTKNQDFFSSKQINCHLFFLIIIWKGKSSSKHG